MAKQLNNIGVANANRLIDKGNVDRTAPWSFDASDGNALLGADGNDWARYSAAHLAIDPSQPEKTRERYRYPFAKLRGGTETLYRAALIAIRQRAAQQGDTDVFAAAGRLLGRIDQAKGHAMNTSRTEHPANLHIEAEATFELEAALPPTVDGEPTPAAPLPRFSMVANTGQPMRLAGWKYPVVMDLSGMQIPSQSRPIRYGHDPMMGVGHTDRVAMSDGKLIASGVISRDTPAARDVVGSAKNGFPWQASIGASVDDVEFVKSGENVTVNGMQFSGPLNVVRKSTLGEISFVDLGADGATVARVAAMAKDDEVLERDTLDAGEDGAGARKAIDRAKTERARQEGIAAAVEEALSFRGADIAEIERISAQAIDEGWTVQATELALLRVTRPRAPQVRKADLPTPKVLEASLCLNLGVRDEVLAKDRDYGAEVVQKAWPLRTRGLRGTIAAALEASGVHVPHGARELFDAVLEARHVQASGFSTINLPGILGNVANKVLLNAFTNVEATYDLIADQADFTNFHTHTIYRLDHLGEFAQVPKDGEIPHGSLSDTSYTNKLETYGQMLTITRQDIVNDDLNAFRSLTAQLARKARIAVEKALYSKVMEASDSFYTTGRGNRLVGALDINALGAAEAAMLGMADAGGDPIYAVPKFLVVPPQLKYLADQIYTSAFLSDFTTGKAKPTDNPFRGRFTVVTSPYMSAAAMSGSSSSTWYLLADPLVLPAFQVAYLDGRRAPTVETADAEFSSLGLRMRCYWDFGVAQLDYRGAIKSTAS